MWTILKAFIENLLQYCFCLMFWFFGHEVCRILAPQPGMQMMPPAVEAWSLNHWTTREVPRVSLYQTFGLTLSAGIQTGTTWGDMESDESPRCPQTWQDHPG